MSIVCVRSLAVEWHIPPGLCFALSSRTAIAVHAPCRRSSGSVAMATAGVRGDVAKAQFWGFHVRARGALVERCGLSVFATVSPTLPMSCRIFDTGKPCRILFPVCKHLCCRVCLRLRSVGRYQCQWGMLPHGEAVVPGAIHVKPGLDENCVGALASAHDAVPLCFADQVRAGGSPSAQRAPSQIAAVPVRENCRRTLSDIKPLMAQPWNSSASGARFSWRGGVDDCSVVHETRLGSGRFVLVVLVGSW